MPELDSSDQDPATPFVDRLEHQLRAASVRHVAESQEPTTTGRLRFLPSPSLESFSPWGRRLAFAAIVLLLASVATVWPGDQDPVAADVFSVEQQGESVEVSVTELVSDVDAAAQELRAAGLEATIVEVPVSPSLVGRLVSVRSPGSIDLETTSADGVTVDSFMVGVEDGSFVIEVGRAAGNEETYLYASEPEMCERLDGLVSTVEIREALGGQDHSIRWFFAEGADVQEIAEEQLADLSLVVTEVVPERVDTSIVFVATDRSQLACGG